MPTAIATTLSPASKEQRADTKARCNPCPTSGRRKGALGYVRALKDAYGFTDPDEALAKLSEHYTGDWEPGVLEGIVSYIFGTSPTGTDGAGRWPEPDVAETERIVAAYPVINVDTLRRSSRNRASDYSQAQIIESLFYPKALVCIGMSREAAMVWPIETVTGKRSDQLPKWEFIVANPMRAQSGKVKRLDGTTYDSSRCKENSCLDENRRW